MLEQIRSGMLCHAQLDPQIAASSVDRVVKEMKDNGLRNQALKSAGGESALSEKDTTDKMAT